MVTTFSDGKDQNGVEAPNANRNRGNYLWKPRCERLVGNAQIERNLSRKKQGNCGGQGVQTPMGEKEYSALK